EEKEDEKEVYVRRKDESEEEKKKKKKQCLIFIFISAVSKTSLLVPLKMDDFGYPIDRGCPPLNNLTENPQIITAENAFILRLSNYNNYVGAKVNVSCPLPYILEGERSLTCLPNKFWSNNATCHLSRKEDTVFDEKKLVIGLSTGLVLLCLLVILIFTIVKVARCRATRKQRGQRKGVGFKGNSQHTNFSNPILAATTAIRPLNGETCPGYSSSSQTFLLNIPDRHVPDIPVVKPVTIPQVEASLKGESESMRLSILPQRFLSWENPPPDKYKFEEINVHALQQGRDPFLWKPVPNNMYFDTVPVSGQY
ncbi:hypothetical protein Ahia01_000850100, partial [Argonauta hians]